MQGRIVIECGDIPTKQLYELRDEIQEIFNKTVEGFTERHPDISIPSGAVRAEVDVLGLKFSRGIL